MDEWDWAHQYFTELDIAELSDISDQLVYDEEHGMNIFLSFSNRQCKEILHHYYNTRNLSKESLESGMFIAGFITTIVKIIEDYFEGEDDEFV